MPCLTTRRLTEYRAESFRHHRPLKDRDEAIAFVKARGLLFFWPIKGIPFPSLWEAVAGPRPVASSHHDPAHRTWRWKDGLLGKRKWYYAKLLRGKGTIVAPEVVPYFYALSANYGEPEVDYLQNADEGLLSPLGKRIFEALLEAGSLDTVSLRRQLGVAGKSSNSAFEKAMVALQQDFKIMPVGVSKAGAWRYSFIYQPTHQHVPDWIAPARHLSEREARQQLIHLAARSLGALTLRDAERLFQWESLPTQRALDALVEAGALVADVQIEGARTADGYALAELL